MDSWLESPLNKVEETFCKAMSSRLEIESRSYACCFRSIKKRSVFQAHFYDRRATVLVKGLHFDEAIECHLSAARFLAESIKSTDNKKARESIELQKDYHLKQKDFLRLKKLQYQAFKEQIRVQKEAMSRMKKARECSGKFAGSESEEICLQKAIYKTIEEADSLLEILVHKEDYLDRDTIGAGSNESKRDNNQIPKGNIQPKGDKTVIEELRIVNYQLRTLILELMSRLTASEKEADGLRQRVAELEAENRRLAPEFASASDYSSPFVFSPEDELPASVPAELPPLAPLEMPDFDLSVLHKKYPANDQGS